MRARHIHPRLAVFAFLALVPLACESSDEVTALLIDEQNAETVASQTAGAMDFVGQMSDLTQTFLPVLEGNAQMIPCAEGNMTIAGNDAAPVDELSTGDWARITFNGCVFNLFGQPVTLNGALMLTVDEITGAAPGPFAVSYTVEYSSLTLIILGVTFNVDGAFTLELSSTDGVTVLAAVSGAYLSGLIAAGDDAFSGTVKNFRREHTLNTETGAYTFTFTADVVTSEGAADFDTSTTFSGVLGSDPDLGEIVVTGGMGATLTLRALDNVNVEILVDVDGDGITDATILTTWDQL